MVTWGEVLINREISPIRTCHVHEQNLLPSVMRFGDITVGSINPVRM